MLTLHFLCFFVKLVADASVVVAISFFLFLSFVVIIFCYNFAINIFKFLLYGFLAGIKTTVFPVS